MRRRSIVALVACVALVVQSHVAGADGRGGHGPPRGRHAFPPAVAAKLETAITAARTDYAVPGMTLGVQQPGVGEMHVTAGYADVARHTPITPVTHFRIGSVTKTFTATVVLQLVEERRLALSQDVAAWFPQLPDAASITIQELLEMRSGIYDEGGPGSLLSAAADKDPHRAWTPQQIVDFAVQDGSQPPGTPGYSDTNYVMLGAIASAVTHTPYPELLARRILRPLDLEHTSFPTTSLVMPMPAATPYTVVLAEHHAPVVRTAETLNPSVLAGAGAMISTLGDLERWARALGTGELLSPPMQRLRLELVGAPVGVFGGLPPVANDQEYPAAYGLGIIGVDNFFGHNGIVNGFTTELWFDPSSGASVVILFNSEILLKVPSAPPSSPNPPDLEFLPISTGLFTTIAEVLQGQA